MTDTERIDWLQAQLDKCQYTGMAMFRWSSNGRGIRLHETSRQGAKNTIREAIDTAIQWDIDGA